MLYGPYFADRGSKINYVGNKIFPPRKDISSVRWPARDIANRYKAMMSQPIWQHIHQINSSIFYACVDYFKKTKADWVNLPLTTLMISSPGEVYAGKLLDYTTDTLPIEIHKWFNKKDKVFLSESSQFYLELALTIPGNEKVFAIYNSFRKEKADITHLTEFQHIEFEGHLSFEENIQIIYELMDHILKYLIKNNTNNLEYFLENTEIQGLEQGIRNAIQRIQFEKALEELYKHTGNEKYQELSLKNFGDYEEILITQILGGPVLLTNFPLLQIPFYHNFSQKSSDGTPLAENADLVLYGYREAVGSGTRIKDPITLAEKAKIFNLPIKQYKPYLKIRESSSYRSTSGFGLGLQRFVQWVLKLPSIWDSTLFPRGHTLPQP